jgi:two-component system, NarL family, invasion response regulator UvrY
MSDRVKVLVIEDHPLIRDGCQSIFRRRPDIEVAEASSAETGIALNTTFDPDVIVLDIGLPDANGFDIISKLISDNEKAKVVILSMYGTQGFVTNALERGAKAYITKNDDPNTILAAIDKVRAGEIYLGQAVAQDLAMAKLSLEQDPLRDLSKKEQQIIKLLGDGKSLAEIAFDLGMSYKTVANTVSQIKQKMRLTTTASLIKFAVELTLRR